MRRDRGYRGGEIVDETAPAGPPPLDVNDLPEIEKAWAAHAGDVVFLRLSRPIRSKDEAAYYRDMAEALLHQTQVHLVFLDDGTEIVSPTTGEAM